MENQFHEIKEAKEENEKAGAERIAAAEAAAAEGAFDEQAAQAEAKLASDLERAEAMKAEQGQNKTDFEAAIEDEIRLAAEVRNHVSHRLDEQEKQAEVAKVAGLAKADEEKEAGSAAFSEARAAVEAEVAAEKRHDDIALTTIKDEIKEVAEKLLAINAQIQEHLNALMEL